MASARIEKVQNAPNTQPAQNVQRIQNAQRVQNLQHDIQIARNVQKVQDAGKTQNIQRIQKVQAVQKLEKTVKCLHSELAEPSGLALVTIGNSLRGDDGIAADLCNALPETAIEDVCRFDLGSYTGFLADCIEGHKAAIVVDSTCNGTTPGTVSIMDLGALLDRTTPLNIKSCHGFSLADELRLAKRHGKLPKRMIFFGVEVADVDWADKLTPALEQRLPQLVKNLSLLVLKVLETLKRDA